MANVTGTLIPDLLIPNAFFQGEFLPDFAEDDMIDGLDGDDSIAAALGNDRVVGGFGDDKIFGNQGNDTLEGNAGNDTIFAGRDDDYVFAASGDDWIFGNRGRDSLRGGTGHDTIYGGKDADILQGEAGNDILFGDLGADTMSGGGGDDVFAIGRRPDTIAAASTGGPLESDADVIQDFRQYGDDRIQLLGGLTFADLVFTEQQIDGIPTGNAIVRDAGETGDILAIVEGVSAEALQNHPQWFTPYTSAPASKSEPEIPPESEPNPVADLQVTKTVEDLTPDTPFFPGDEIQYTLEVTNHGGDNATDVRLLDLWPDGLTFASATATRGTYDGNSGVWNIGNLNNGGSHTLTIRATIDTDATVTIANTATVTGNPFDPNLGNNTSESAAFTVVQPPASEPEPSVEETPPTSPEPVAPDLLVAKFSQGGVSQLQNDGTGNFPTQSHAAVGEFPLRLAVGDLNGDDRTDAIAVNSGDGNITPLLRDDDGELVPQANVTVGDRPIDTALGDIDSNGTLDAVVTNFQDDTVSVLRGNGSGGFDSEDAIAVGDGPTAIVFGDFDGNGDLDAATTNFFDETVSILLGDGNTLTRQDTDIPVGSSPIDIAAGDLNGDGKSDLVVTNRSSNTLSLLLSNGGTGFTGFTPQTLTSSSLVTPVSVVLSDVNGDTELDAIVSNQGNDTVAILLNDGMGNLSVTASLDVGAGSDPDGVAVGDVNADGIPDIVTANASTNEISIFTGGGNGAFEPVAAVDVGAPTQDVALI